MESDVELLKLRALTYAKVNLIWLDNARHHMCVWFKTIGKVSGPCTRSSFRRPTLSTVGEMELPLKNVTFSEDLPHPGVQHA